MSLKNKKLLLTLLFLLALALGIFAWYRFDARNDEEVRKATKTNVEGQLDQENRDLDDSQDDGSTGQTPTDNRTNANPVLTRLDSQSGRVEAAGFVQGAYEDGGKCTYLFTSGDMEVKKETEGFKDATTTNCPPVDFSSSELSGSSMWEAQLIYDSSNSYGTSAKQTLRL